MNSTEKDLLTRFLQQLESAQAGQKDAEAEALIRQAAARQPDAAYLLVQRTIQLEQLLAASQSELQRLQSQSSTAGASSGFLGDPNAWGRSAGANPIPGAAAGSAAAQRPGQQTAAAAQAAPARGGGWGSGLFGNIATTAAGVVAGSFLFQGIQGLMNRNDPQTASATPEPEQLASAGEPELLNSYETPAEDLGGDMADAGDSGDFA
jgi:hypothetical protein